MTIEIKYFQENSQVEEKIVHFEFFSLSIKKDKENLMINIKTSFSDDFFLVSKEKNGLAKILHSCFLERQDCKLELVSTKNGAYLDMVHIPVKPIWNQTPTNTRKKTEI